MSDALVKAAVEQPAALEHRLVTALREVAVGILAKPEILRAMAAVEAIADGLVVADDAQAIAIGDSVKAVIDGEKFLATSEGLLLRIPRQAEAAIKQATAETRDRFALAKRRGNDARVAWQNTLRRQAAAEEERRRKKAEAATAEAVRMAKESGDHDTPPLPDVVAPPVQRIVSGGSSKSYTQVRVNPVEIVDDAKCPPGWKLLIKPIAKGFFDTAVREGKIAKPGPGESVIYQGVRFEAVESAVNR